MCTWRWSLQLSTRITSFIHDECLVTLLVDPVQLPHRLLAKAAPPELMVCTTSWPTVSITSTLHLASMQLRRTCHSCSAQHACPGTRPSLMHRLKQLRCAKPECTWPEPLSYVAISRKALAGTQTSSACLMPPGCRLCTHSC